MRRSIYTALAVLGLSITLSGCWSSTNATDEAVQTKQAAMQAEQVRQTGLPGITNFTEAKLVKRLYELRDQKISTYTYVMNINGQLLHVCDSIGYGLPYGVQFSNPEKNVWTDGADHTHSWVNTNLPQAEPNGLYMPPTAEGTWVMCANPKADGGFDPLYVEPRVVTSPFKLHSVGSWTEPEVEHK